MLSSYVGSDTLDVNKLKAFMCVVRWQSFTKASAELFISQPALSKKISDFEKELGTALLIRDNRIMELTPAGKLLYTEAPAFLKIGDDLESKVRELGLRPGSQLSIGCSGIEYGRIRQVLEGFRAQHPDVSINLHRYTAAEIKRLTLTNMIDIAFQTHFEVEKEPEVAYIPFCRDELAIIMSKSHPLAHEKEVGMEQFQDETYIGIQPQQDHMPFTRMINSLCQNGYRPKEIRVAESVDELLLAVSCGLGIAHLFMQTKEANCGLVQYVPAKEPKIELQIDLVWNRNNQNPATGWFAEYVRRENERLAL